MLLQLSFLQFGITVEQDQCCTSFGIGWTRWNEAEHNAEYNIRWISLRSHMKGIHVACTRKRQDIACEVSWMKSCSTAHCISLAHDINSNSTPCCTQLLSESILPTTCPPHYGLYSVKMTGKWWWSMKSGGCFRAAAGKAYPRTHWWKRFGL